MTPKEYLLQYRRCVCKTLRLKQNIDRLRDQAGGLTAIQYDKDRVQSSHVPDKMGEVIAKMADLEESYSAEILESAYLMNAIESVIMQVSQTECQTLLWKRYIDLEDDGKLKTWQTICDEMSYSWAGVHKVHKRALKEVERIINN